MRVIFGWSMLLWLAVPAHAGVGRLPVGTRLPALVGETLAGPDLRLPEAARGRVTLIAMGFSYASRHAVEPWMDRFRRDFARDSAVTFYELPMMSGIGPRLGKPFIDSGMRRGTPSELHARVATVWTDVATWRRRLAVRDQDLAYLILIDRDGRVVWNDAVGRGLDGYDALVERVRDTARR